MTTSLDLIKKDLKHLDKIIEIYTEDLNEADILLKLTNKKIDMANAEHSGWKNYYHAKEVEVKYLKEYIRSKLDEVHGELWVKYTEKMDRVLTQKDKEQYIKREPIYLNILSEFLKIQELHEQFIRLNESFTTRGYVLNNLTRLITSDTNDWIIP